MQLVVRGGGSLFKISDSFNTDYIFTKKFLTTDSAFQMKHRR